MSTWNTGRVILSPIESCCVRGCCFAGDFRVASIDRFIKMPVVLQRIADVSMMGPVCENLLM